MKRVFYFFLCSLLVSARLSANPNPSGTPKKPLSVKTISRHSPETATTNAATVVFRVTFSDRVSGVDAGDFVVASLSGNVTGRVGNVVRVGGSGKQFNVSVVNLAGAGRIRLNLKESGTGITDEDGNPLSGGYTSGEIYTIDRVGPSVVSINRRVPASENTTATSVTFRVTFSESVSGVDVSDFFLSGTANGVLASNAVSAPISGATIFDVTVSSITRNGTLQLNLKQNGTNIKDHLGNPITGGFTTGESYNIVVQPTDVTRPRVTAINRQIPEDEQTTESTVTFAITFSEPVLGVDAGDFELFRSGTVNGLIGALSGTGANYTLTVTNISGAGVLRLDLKNEQTDIVDAAGNPIEGGFSSGQSYNITPVQVYGFASIMPLSPVAIGDNGDTQHKPQGKVWFYAGKWWSVMSTTTGTKIFRLDGTAWTEALHIFNSGGRADAWVDNNLVHVFLHRNTLNSPLITVEYDAALGNYKPWSQRPGSTGITLPAGTETATIAVDGIGRLWLTSTGTTDVLVWYADAPYTSWSAPITIASGISDDDISTITRLPGKVGVLWSNQTTGLFGFKTHNDGDAPGTWSADEVPASQSAIPGNPNMADDHMNVVVASNGTLYAAIKTSYSITGTLPLVGLLVRQPNGTWDRLHTVTTVSEDGTQPIVVLNEALGRVKVIYTSITNGGEIVYKESLTNALAFGERRTLISGGGPIYNFASSSHFTYNPEIVVIATKVTLPRAVISVLASDINTASNQAPAIAAGSSMRKEAFLPEIQENKLKVYPTLVRKGQQVFLSAGSVDLNEVRVVDAYGRVVQIIRFKGNTLIDTRRMNSGAHYLIVREQNRFRTLKILVAD